MKKTLILIAITLSGLLAVSSLFSANSNGSISVRVAAYNVEYGKNASPEEIGRMFKPYNFDIIGFNEVPDDVEIVGFEHSANFQTLQFRHHRI